MGGVVSVAPVELLGALQNVAGVVIVPIRSLQAVGGLPDLWNEEDEPLDCTGYGELLYIDPDTRMSFQVYHLTLSRNTMSMRLMVDIQSGRILSFTLQWGQEDIPSWGLRGAAPPSWRRSVRHSTG